MDFPKTFAVLALSALLDGCAANGNSGISTSVGLGFGRSISSNAAVGVGISTGPIFNIGGRSNRPRQAENNPPETQPDDSAEKTDDNDISDSLSEEY